MKNIRLIIAYDGNGYLGWQKTAAGPSIEQTLQSTLETILQEKIELQAASRTDAGVHAQGQVVNFLSKNDDYAPTLVPDRLSHKLNRLLPRDITVLDVTSMPLDFHPTIDCIGKEYHYAICNHPLQLPHYRNLSWHFPYPLKVSEMRRAAEQLKGTHDFSAFCNAKRIAGYDNHVRTITTLDLIELPDQRLQIHITGDHFLYKMVRNIVGTLAHVGMGKILADDIPAILASGDRKLAGITAPAHGLYLHRVVYS